MCRRVSRGSIYLGFSSWRQFLEEFVSRAGLELERVTEQLEQCGAPSHTHTTQIQQRSSTASHAHLGRRLAARCFHNILLSPSPCWKCFYVCVVLRYYVKFIDTFTPRLAAGL